jgi:NAD(P)H-dependent flavin oxidoreductase YrpB (nitropropane dioxygenase family)
MTNNLGSDSSPHPTVIQGGMGIAVSNWTLARAVSMAGQLGIVSGTAITSVLVRRLQDGDVDGSMRRALAAFPNQDISRKILETYFIDGGRKPATPYKLSPMFQLKSSDFLLQLTVAAAFAEVYLAKEGHAGLVGLNLLEKIQLPNLACLYGGLLAGVDYVVMGAGIPREIPGALDLLSQHLPARLKIPVEGAPADAEYFTELNPEIILQGRLQKPLKRPFFFPIVSSAVLATSLKRKSTGEVNGFIVEGPVAGGHNAPPRGPMKLSEQGEPIYGPRDEVSFADMQEIGLPFWYAGSFATPEKLKMVLDAGGNGVQVGTLFAFAEESGLDPHLKTKVLQGIRTEQYKNWIFTDPVSSPTGFPFKAVRLPGSMSEVAVYESRTRICDLGYLRHAYWSDGKVGLRCPAEPVDQYVKKGGSLEETKGRKCLCNALMADIGMPQVKAGGEIELPLLTAGDDLNQLHRILGQRLSYSAADVLNYMTQNANIQLASKRLPLHLSPV